MHEIVFSSYRGRQIIFVGETMLSGSVELTYRVLWWLCKGVIGDGCGGVLVCWCKRLGLNCMPRNCGRVRVCVCVCERESA